MRTEKGQGTIELLFGVAILLVLLIVVFQALVPIAMQAGEGIENAIKDIPFSNSSSNTTKEDIVQNIYIDAPLTKHAEESHSTQTWNAIQIQRFFNEGGCTPKNYECPQDDYTVHYCELNAGKAVGLIIGRTVEVIITGFMADTSYWQDRCSQTP